MTDSEEIEKLKKEIKQLRDIIGDLERRLGNVTNQASKFDEELLERILKIEEKLK